MIVWVCRGRSDIHTYRGNMVVWVCWNGASFHT